MDDIIFPQVTAIAPKISTSPKDQLSYLYPSSLEDSTLPAVWSIDSSQLLTVSFFKPVSAAEPSHPWSCPSP